MQSYCIIFFQLFLLLDKVIKVDGLVVVDCRVGSVGSGDYALGPVVLVEILGGNVRVAHVSGRHRQPRNGQSHIARLGNGVQSHREDAEKTNNVC